MKPEEFSALDETAISNHSYHHDAQAATSGGGAALIINSNWHLSSSTSTICLCG